MAYDGNLVAPAYYAKITMSSPGPDFVHPGSLKLFRLAIYTEMSFSLLQMRYYSHPQPNLGRKLQK